jgi:hypothetical protein
MIEAVLRPNERYVLLGSFPLMGTARYTEVGAASRAGVWLPTPRCSRPTCPADRFVSQTSSMIR